MIQTAPAPLPTFDLGCLCCTTTVDTNINNNDNSFGMYSTAVLILLTCKVVWCVCFDLFVD
jgi:hypothetical protein